MAGKDLLRKFLIGVAGILGVPLVAAKGLSERVYLPNAKATIQHHRLKPGCEKKYLPDGSPDPEAFELVSEEVTHNIILKSGRDQMHLQCYGTSGLATNGFNYVALSNTLVTTDDTSTTLAGEISANGLSRAQGAYAHSSNTNTTTITKTFTCSGSSQACQTAGFFNASSSGTGQHFLGFTQRTLQPNDTITITLTVTMG